MEGPAVLQCQFCGDYDLSYQVDAKVVTLTLTLLELEGLQYFHRNCAQSARKASCSYSLGDTLDLCLPCKEPFLQLCELVQGLKSLKGKLDKVRGQLEDRVRTTGEESNVEEVQIKIEVESDIESEKRPELDRDLGMTSFPEEGPLVKIEIEPEDHFLQPESPEPFNVTTDNPHHSHKSEPDSPPSLRRSSRDLRRRRLEESLSDGHSSESEEGEDYDPGLQSRRKRQQPNRSRKKRQKQDPKEIHEKTSTESPHKKTKNTKVVITPNKKLMSVPITEMQQSAASLEDEGSASEEDFDLNVAEDIDESSFPENEEKDPSFKNPVILSTVSVEYKRKCLDWIAANPNAKFKTVKKKFSKLVAYNYVQRWRQQVAEFDRRMSLPPKIPTCSDCGRTFKKTAHLTQHVKRIHQGGVKVVCDICGKVLAKRSLVDHLNSHNNVRPYQCSYCGKSFVRECTYQEHVRIHTGEKPYECNLCGRKFTQNSGLKAHLVSHERVGDKARTTDWRMKERKSKPGEEEQMQDFPVSLEQDPVQLDQVHCAVRN